MPVASANGTVPVLNADAYLFKYHCSLRLHHVPPSSGSYTLLAQCSLEQWHRGNGCGHNSGLEGLDAIYVDRGLYAAPSPKSRSRRITNRPKTQCHPRYPTPENTRISSIGRRRREMEVFHHLPFERMIRIQYGELKMLTICDYEAADSASINLVSTISTEHLRLCIQT